MLTYLNSLQVKAIKLPENLNKVFTSANNWLKPNHVEALMRQGQARSIRDIIIVKQWQISKWVIKMITRSKERKVNGMGRSWSASYTEMTTPTLQENYS